MLDDGGSATESKEEQREEEVRMGGHSGHTGESTAKT